VTAPPFPSDHAKRTIYEGGINVPFILSGDPVQQPGSEVTAVVNTTDVFATVLELASAAPPADRAIDSTSLVPYLSDPAGAQRRLAFSETGSRKAIRNDRFKLILKDGVYELYDLEGQPPSDPPRTPSRTMTCSREPARSPTASAATSTPIARRESPATSRPWTPSSRPTTKSSVSSCSHS
jgi:arylsulfatase A-like enzyme